MIFRNSDYMKTKQDLKEFLKKIEKIRETRFKEKSWRNSRDKKIKIASEQNQPFFEFLFFGTMIEKFIVFSISIPAASSTFQPRDATKAVPEICGESLRLDDR